MKHIHFILLFFIAMPFHSCEDEGTCTGVKVARVGAGFYVRDGDLERDTTLSGLTFYSIERPDSLIYDSIVNVRLIRFPLPVEEESDTWFVFQLGSVKDSIRVRKHSEMVLVSYACGFAANHLLNGVESQNIIIDTIKITIPDIAFFDEENIKIYIKPAPAADTIP